jgi:hypothetical protein
MVAAMGTPATATVTPVMAMATPVMAVVNHAAQVAVATMAVMGVEALTATEAADIGNSPRIISRLRFAGSSRPSRCEEDLHLLAVDHAWHTKRNGWQQMLSAVFHYEGASG